MPTLARQAGESLAYRAIQAFNQGGIEHRSSLRSRKQHLHLFQRSSRRYRPTTHGGADNSSAPALTTDLPGCNRASSSRRLPTTSASRPSSLNPFRQSFYILSPGSHRPARAPDPGALVAPRPDGPAGNASLFDLASLPLCVHPTQTPAQSLECDNLRPITSQQSRSGLSACVIPQTWCLSGH
jgi:hypothetical protein